MSDNWTAASNVGIVLEGDITGAIVFTDVTMTGNQGGSVTYGTGIYVDTDVQIDITNLTATSNISSSGTAPGAVFITCTTESATGARVSIKNSAFTSNSAGDSGAVKVSRFFSVELDNITFTSNSDTFLGGGALALYATLESNASTARINNC